MLVSVALYCALHVKRVTLQINNICLVNTLQILMDGPFHNKDLPLAQVIEVDGEVDLF